MHASVKKNFLTSLWFVSRFKVMSYATNSGYAIMRFMRFKHQRAAPVRGGNAKMAAAD
jgi:hypothetical protein